MTSNSHVRSRDALLAKAREFLSVALFDRLRAVLDRLGQCPYARIRDGGEREVGIHVRADLPDQGISPDYALFGLVWKETSNQLDLWLQAKGHNADTALFTEFWRIIGAKPSKDWRTTKATEPEAVLQVAEDLLDAIDDELTQASVSTGNRDFQRLATMWFDAAVEEFGYTDPDRAILERLFKEIPTHVAANIASGVMRDVIIPQGAKFNLAGLPAGKGPYSWYSRHSGKETPRPNWECFIQVGEYVRYEQIAEANGLTLLFEDDLMDLSLYEDGRLVVCCEVKRYTSQLDNLLRDMEQWQAKIDFSQPDRGIDPLRKAKYLVRCHPKYFALVAANDRRCFKVSYPENSEFHLTPADFPYIT